MTMGAAVKQNSLEYHYVAKEHDDWCPMKKGFLLLKKDGPCVKFHNKKKNWYGASSICMSYSPYSRLLVLSRRRKGILMKQHGKSMAGVMRKSYWIGLRETNKNAYRWIDGTRLRYRDWDVNGDHSFPKVKDYVSLKKGKWTCIRTGCRRRNRFVCEIQLNLKTYHGMMDM